MYVLDTNTLIYLFKGMGRIGERMQSVSSGEVGISTLVLYELYVGIAKSQNPTRRKQLLESLTSQSIILPFDQKAAKVASQIRARLESMGQPIGPIDTLITGVAMAQDATLITHNVKEFSRVGGLSIEDWYC
ncbi:type II toxin-antitoxin system VapC family toxin [Leptothoe spongobia]|uniref:Ribonuclease VapC n=1 Tax=Leptothoe spongobia TAU-MAC 1115 TaxID=1967444 RepID=A0A947DB89_9CYAN|nr:type II toxin-antitoxin system VapC family toxin [Leptothoe spongobia]MBT9314003.1 type II toxin-antitoxin system VapC family toxin [Leptothoe spongobia TAU-MAC 1115]